MKATRIFFYRSLDRFSPLPRVDAFESAHGNIEGFVGQRWQSTSYSQDLYQKLPPELQPGQSQLVSEGSSLATQNTIIDNNIASQRERMEDRKLLLIQEQLLTGGIQDSSLAQAFASIMIPMATHRDGRKQMSKLLRYTNLTTSEIEKVASFAIGVSQGLPTGSSMSYNSTASPLLNWQTLARSSNAQDAINPPPEQTILTPTVYTKFSNKTAKGFKNTYWMATSKDLFLPPPAIDAAVSGDFFQMRFKPTRQPKWWYFNVGRWEPLELQSWPESELPYQLVHPSEEHQTRVLALRPNSDSNGGPEPFWILKASLNKAQNRAEKQEKEKANGKGKGKEVERNGDEGNEVSTSSRGMPFLRATSIPAPQRKTRQDRRARTPAL